jgi:5-methylcytosine-specific restriction endonuclease McrA
MGKRRRLIALRASILELARHRCDYCQVSELVTGSTLELDHLLPESLGGETIEENLWAACRECNNAKGQNVTAVDAQTGEMVRLFSPRKDVWSDHFRWSEDGTTILGLSSIGRATIELLKMNRRNAVLARRVWVKGGAHPPA